ncbi:MULTISPECIES: hypothetical protein [unclassified Coleofasciculus]|uniref:hypothetical protein n=1 Tax=unclassified Coleofasciculus TaxID=2692782 RepID=UPI0018816668|nr:MULTISPECIES: hypothetical protein [unclassified Coleofasciculus]MBE9126652.1 hypothetical protein [Coleofasciculus sp. LEGE 07081]MBE9148494.1 hypothetical protein [Coleofasciculus sp. LEGE 07092]
MLRKFIILFMSLALCGTTLACSSPAPTQSQTQNTNTTSAPTSLSNGKYPVQQATYNDANGEYTLMLLNTSPGTPPVFRTTDLRMARLTDEEMSADEKTYLAVENGQADMHLSEDFRIEYVHNVTETQTNPQTGQPQTVIVRQQSSFWTPFAGALAGQAVGSLLFRPSYYVPPVYQPGVVLTGYGGYGNTYSQAVNRYQTRHQEPPPAVKNRQVLRTTGAVRKSPSNQPTAERKASPNSNRATGSGFGSSTLRQSNRSRQAPAKTPSGFGSGRSRKSRRR